MYIKNAARDQIKTIGIGSSEMYAPTAMNATLSRENAYATFVACSIEILSAGIGLFGFAFASIETSAMSLNVFPAAMKQIAEVV